ncbi:MAG: SDR family NAD(P)-dependent oxidoreductase [Flavobacteriales bacterium]
MRGFIITGTSSGIGHELCKLLLENPDNKVVGIGRTQNIEHTNYHHIALDLNNISEIENIEFPSWSNAAQISLIHNAGWIGPIQKIGNQELGAIASAYIINLVAPAVLSSQFISIYKNSKAQKVILSVSSGAAQSAVEGWSTYCSSKAGLDMLSKCINEEYQDIINLSIAPGKVDTPMQNDIRFADEKAFPRLNEFQKYYKDGELADAKEVAAKYKKILQNPKKYLQLNRITDI